MGGAVVLCRGQQADVVWQLQARHERRDELVGRRAPERTVLRRDDDPEAAGRRSDEFLLREPVQRELDGIGRNTQFRLHLAGGEVIAATRGKVADVLTS